MEEAREIGKGKVVVLFFLPPTFLMGEADPWPPDAISEIVRFKYPCVVQRGMVPGPGGQPTPGMALSPLGDDLDLTAGSWAGSRRPDQDEMRVFDDFRRKMSAARADLVIAGPGDLRGLHGLKGGRH